MTEHEYKVDALLSDIDGILGNRAIENIPMQERVALSVKIMARLREECIFVKNSKITEFEKSGVLVTIPNHIPEVKRTLEANDREGRGDDEYCRIHANSFGAFLPEHYFNTDNRILWLLKEPFVQDGDLSNFLNGLRDFLGGNNQTDKNQYASWSDCKGNATIANSIRIAKIILEALDPENIPLESAQTSDVMSKVMEHVCIIQVNHFPGLAFNGNWSSDDNLLQEWATPNIDLLQKLVDFYNPNVILCGGTLDIIYPILDIYNSAFKTIPEEIKNGKFEIFKDAIIDWTYMTRQ